MDFDQLVAEAQFGQSKTGEHALWKAALTLDRWYFLGAGQDDDVEPMFAQHDGKTHLLAFTDEDRAQAMAEQLEQRSGSRPAILHMDVPDAIDYLRVLDEDGQVAGVHFNNGAHAFGESLVNIIEMSKRYRG
ncbi:MAG: hypothetical protein D6695_11480 [Planctomycetota bacterium]|nr:MAG: hypothetical protein D6695_11480 [Planctomycetota bacterium]